MKYLLVFLAMIAALTLLTTATTNASLTSTSANITGTINAASGTVVLDSNGITITSGGATGNRLKFTDGSYVQGASDGLALYADSIVYLMAGGTAGDPVLSWDGSKFFGGNSHPDLGGTSNRWSMLYATGANVSGDAIFGNVVYISDLANSGRRYLCIENNGAISADDTAC